jgi:hypothetical protein
MALGAFEIVTSLRCTFGEWKKTFGTDIWKILSGLASIADGVAALMQGAPHRTGPGPYASAMANQSFRMVLDGANLANAPHLVTALGKSDPFRGETLCGVTSELNDFGKSCVGGDPEVCEACLREAHKRWRANDKA